MIRYPSRHVKGQRSVDYTKSVEVIMRYAGEPGEEEIWIGRTHNPDELVDVVHHELSWGEGAMAGHTGSDSFISVELLIRDHKRS